jgi:glutamate-ammonia-ligase adenylyltransferase
LLAVTAGDLGEAIAVLRRTWSRAMLDIALCDIFGKCSMDDAKRAQTMLAEASIAAAITIAGEEMARKYGPQSAQFPLAVLALGKLGGRSLDYDSDLDLLLVYDDSVPVPADLTHAEFYSRAVELFVTALSSATRDGHLYRIDLRLRPYGSKGLSSMPADAFLKYMDETAAIWELLAFVKLRAVGGDMALARAVEQKTRQVIHQRASQIPRTELTAEVLLIREALEKKRTRVRRQGDVDIKYGAGGLLDVYFATRFLQLRDNLPDEENDRSTNFVLQRLSDIGSADNENCHRLAEGYKFLSALDHNLRLTVGRTTRLPAGDVNTLSAIAARMHLDSPNSLLQHLTLHRLEIREAFDGVLKS